MAAYKDLDDGTSKKPGVHKLISTYKKLLVIILVIIIISFQHFPPYKRLVEMFIQTSSISIV